MITFKNFLAEKAMNRAEFAKAAERHSDAKIGFEFECVISEKSELLANGEVNREWTSLNKITDFNELFDYFEIDKVEKKTITKEYDNWVQTKSEDDEIEWENFISDEYKSVYNFVKANGFIPTYGWEADTGQSSARIYIGGLADMDIEEMQKGTFSNIEDDLSDHLEQNVTIAWRESKEHFDRGDWLVVPDRSITAGAVGVGAEIISPPQTLMKALQDLKSMFSWMVRQNVETNITTGLHINISMPGIENADLLKLVLFMGDRYVLKQFDRLSNTFTKPQTDAIVTSLTGIGKLPKEADAMVKLARSALSTAKYSSVHIEKIKSGYLEFRIAGNAEYHTKYDLIYDTILRFVLALEIAIDPAAERNEYLKKVTKILGKVEAADENTDLDSRSLADILEFGDQEDIAKELNVWMADAKAGRITSNSTRQRYAKDWFQSKLLSGLFRAFSELGIKKSSDRHKAEFRLILKRLGITLQDVNISGTLWEDDILKKLGIRK